MTTGNSEWYKTAFDSEYLAVYSHRSDDAAEKEVAWVASRWSLIPDSRVFDLCCGNGRHAAAWSRRGHEVVGLDYSRALLSEARARDLPRARFVRGDMRRVPVRGPFDAVTSFFTSFGYFADDRDDVLVVEEMARLLCPGGVFVLDFLNAQHVRDHLVARSVDEREGWKIIQERSIDEATSRVEKRIETTSPDGVGRVTFESVKLYGEPELQALTRDAGLEIDEVFGSLEGESFSTDSPRLVITGKRSG